MFVVRGRGAGAQEHLVLMFKHTLKLSRNLYVNVCECVCVCVCVFVCVFVCLCIVCVREREEGGGEIDMKRRDK